MKETSKLIPLNVETNNLPTNLPPGSPTIRNLSRCFYRLTNFLSLLHTLLFEYCLICDYLEVKLDAVNKFC